MSGNQKNEKLDPKNSSEEIKDQNSENVEQQVSNTEILISKIADLEAKNKELEDKYIRAYADFENMQKRLEKDKSSAISFANQSFARDLLAVMDSLELSLKSEEINEEANHNQFTKKIREGIELTKDQLIKIFEKNGIVKIDASGQFDPNLHEAIMQVEDKNVKKGDIVAVLQQGYSINGRVLRAAMVSIAK